MDVEEAQSLWSDVERVEIQSISTPEPRLMVIGKWQQKHWPAIVTYRNPIIRIISVRRSRDSEVALDES